jgi:hypothetical protein
MFSASAFAEALPEDTLEPARQQPMPTAATTRWPSRRSHGLLLALGGIAVIGVIAAAVVIASRRHGGTAREDAAVAPPVLDAAMRALDAAAPDAADDAAVADAPAVDAPAPADAAIHHPHDARPHDDPHAKEAEEHLRLAEEARGGGHPLTQLGEADLALKADPRNIRARFLLGDAQIERGDRDRGCKSLRACGRYQPAIDRATGAGCPP